MLQTAGNLLARSRAAGRICVINYHRVLQTPHPLLPSEPDVATFRWQMELLARCFNVLPLRQALALMDAGTLPPRSVCITFDDGYSAVHELALPVLQRFNLPATVFVTSGHLGQNTMWNDRIIEAVQSLRSERLDLRSLGLANYSLRNTDERLATIGVLTEHSKYLPPSKRHALIRQLEEMAGENLVPGQMLTPDMVRALDRNGIEIGAHTVTHPILTSMDDESAQSEITSSKEQLEELLDKPVQLFAYPNGKVGKDYDARHVEMVRRAGFAAAFTTAVGAITKDQDRFQLPRSRPWDRTPFMFGLRLLSWMAQGPPR
ncbi:polysaccharide deacetylase family protein [Massilia sp. ST3]|uniref:polysaccharide deacetylase family protein n=1 Tax=Massilia sp. ST3 TaxID=2824903 RepID=UPI001B81277F|nr:polysaccharide deacetylase family protein [Massilia sp. ST3]MBQ5947389.1 polysaccharide deacetylase family protein [Massilia sp. ST3]